MTPLRVALDARDLTAAAPRGMVRYVVGLARHLPACGVRVTLFHRRREPLNPKHLAGLGCEVVGLRDAGGLTWEQVAVPLALARGGFDVYHAPAERGVPLLAPCPVLLSIHSATTASYQDLVRRGRLPGPPSRYLGFDPARVRRWPALYSRVQLRRANYFATVSEFSRGELIRLMKLPASRVTVTPLAVPEMFLGVGPVSDRPVIRQPYVLFVGGFEAHKNPTGVLDAAAIVRRTRPDVSVVLVGTGTVPPELVRDAEGRGFTPGRDAVFLSDVGEELIAVYDGAAAFLSLSWRETFGVPLLEAMARGVPVVAAAWGAAPEVVGDAGVLVDPRDPAAVFLHKKKGCLFTDSLSTFISYSYIFKNFIT